MAFSVSGFRFDGAVRSLSNQAPGPRTGRKSMRAHLARRFGVLAIAGVIAVAVGGSAAAHPGSAAAPQAGFTLTVGTTLSLTGDGAVFGPAFQKSAEMAVDLANKALLRDGVKDITIKVDSADDGSTPTSAVNAARKLI